MLPKLNVLVVNNSASKPVVLAKILEKDSHSIVLVTNRIEADEYTNGQAPNPILMDIQIPEMDKLTANRIIRAGTSQNKNIPIIAITANSTKKTAL